MKQDPESVRIKSKERARKKGDVREPEAHEKTGSLKQPPNLIRRGGQIYLPNGHQVVDVVAVAATLGTADEEENER